MGLFEFIKGQFASVIEWNPQDPKVLFWKFPSNTNEIKTASKLIIAPGQGCILVYQGEIKDVLDKPGNYAIETDNMPFITTLQKYAQLFESEHKLHIYFYRTAEMANLGWGTASPVKYMDAKHQFPVQLSAYGNFSCRIVDAEKFFVNYIGASSQFSIDDFKEIANSRISQTLISYLSTAQFGFTDLDAKLSVISAELKTLMAEDFTLLGVELLDFRFEGSHFDEETINRIGKIADVRADVSAANEGNLSYVEMQKLQALRDAAQNENGLAGLGASMGVGASMSALLNDSFHNKISAEEKIDWFEYLKKLKELLDQGILSKEEFEQKKAEVLKRL